jgi:hypothetical protein
MKRIPEGPVHKEVKLSGSRKTPAGSSKSKFSRRDGLGDFFSDAWDNVKTIGGDVDNIIDNTASTISSIASGDFGPRSGSVSDLTLPASSTLHPFPCLTPLCFS